MRPSPPIKGLGIALDLLHLQEPFASWPAHELVSTVKGAVKRGHYILLKEDGRFVGIGCWGLCSTETGEAYISGKTRPSFKDCTEGDNLLMFIVYTQKTAQLKALTRFIKEYHPGFKIYARRFHQGRKGLKAKTAVIR